LQQLFATLDRMGFDRELHHLAYDFVTLAGGAMASRKGNVIRYADFRDQLIDSAREETAARHEDWS
jgi:arginyl-tRNA synthetase